MFATPGYAEEPASMIETARSVLGIRNVVGASAHGVLAAGTENESRAVGVMAISGVEAEPFLVGDLRGHETNAGVEIAARLGEPRPEDLVALFPDPHLDVAALVDGMRDALWPARVIGAGSADALGNSAAQWCGTQIETEALAGVVLRGTKPPRIGVTQACRPTGELMTVTRVRGNWVLELDGRPALDAYRSAARGPLADDLGRAANFVLVALPQTEGPLQPGGYLVRHVVGFAEEHGAFAVPTAPRNGDRLAFAIREPEAAREDLKTMLSGLEMGSPALGLYFNCCARGSVFFGVPGLEAAYLDHAFGSVPIAGMFGSCEIGPIGDAATAAPELLTYTAVLALIDG